MRRLLSVLVGVLLTAATAAAAGVSNVAFRDPKPLRYWPTRTDYRFINCPEKTVRYEAEKGAQALILDCPVGDCVLGRNEARPVLRYAGRGEARRAEYRVALSVLEKGAAPRRCAEATVTATDDPAGVEVPLAYTIERPGEDQSVLVEVFPVKADKAEVRCQVPCPLAYLGRVMVTRPTFWTSDASARAWIALNLDAARLRSWKARAILRAEGGREVWSHTFDELRGRLVWFDADIRDLPPGRYDLECEVIDDKGQARERQANSLVKRPLPDGTRRSLPIAVEDAPGLARSAFPACADVPFPNGDLRAGHGARLLDAAGREVPAQLTPTGFWDERRTFVKWLRLAFDADTTGGEGRYALEYGADVRPAEVKGVEAAAGPPVVVRGGALELRLGEPGLLARVVSPAGVVDLSGWVDLVAAGRPRTLDFRAGGGALVRNLSETPWKFRLETDGDGEAAGWAKPDLDDRAWRPIRTDTFWDEQGYTHQGYAWYRVRFSLPPEQVRPDLVLRFGAVDERAWVYLNGEYIGGTGDKGLTWWDKPFDIAAGVKLKAGENFLAVKVHNQAAAGGIWKPVGVFAPGKAATPQAAAPAAQAVAGPALRFDTARPAEPQWAVEESGPLRAVARASGWHTDERGQRSGRYQTRFYVFHNKPFVKIEHTFVFTENANRFLVKEVGLGLRMAGLKDARFGLEEAAATDWRPTAQAAELTQSGSQSFRLTGGPEGKRAAGWVEGRSQAGRVVAFLDEMWQHWPAALRAEDGGLALALYGGQGTAPLDLRNDTAGGSPYGGLGVARTRTVWLWFPGADADAAAVHRAAAQFRHALRPVAPPKWVCFSGITGAPVWPCDPDLFPNEEKQFETAHLGIVHQRDAFDIHGFLDYGDVHHRWDSKNNTWDREYRYWVNNESTCESTTSLHWLQYLRTGKRKFYDFCEQRSWHLMDVDTIHEERPGPLSGQAEEQPPAEDRDPAYRRGVMHVHAINHWFSHAAADHTHADYALWHAHLSGGYRGFDVAAELADTARRGPLARLGCQWRGFHFPSRYAVDLYQHFWDEDLIEFARQNLDVPVVHYPPRVTIGGDDRPILSYDRYVRQTGDAWIRKRCIEGNAGPFVTGYTDHSRAILYSHTRNPDVLRLELLRRVGYAGVTRYLDPICADDFTKLTPPGYGWIYFGVPKYAWVMWALADAKLWPPRPEPAVVRTNAAGGGAWSEGKTWAGGRPPRPEEAAQVVAGDHLVADLPADDSVDCAGLKVEGRLTFGAGARSLVVSGDVVVAKGGSLEIGPGHALRIASEFNAARGLTVESGGSFQCRGASPKQPDAVLAALGDRDDVAAYAHFESGAKALVQNAEVRNLGMAWTFKGRAAATKRLEGRTGIASATADLAPFTGNRVVGCAFGLDLLAVPSKFEVRDCEFRRCKVGLNVRGNRGSEMAVTGCRFEQNETGATLTLSRDAKKPPACEVKGNVFARNTHSGVTLMAVGDSRLTVEDNTYEENEAGFESLSPGKATLARETFVGNRRGLAVQATELTVLAGRFGRSDAGDRANTEADVAFTTGGVTRATEQSGGVRLKGCTLASPVTVGSVERHGKAWVIAEDAAGGPAKPRVWGQPPPEPKPEK